MRIARLTARGVYLVLALATIAPACAVLAQQPERTEAHEHSLKLGAVHFANTGGPAAQAPFQRGIALLHSYEYADAREAFREAERVDPRFALAYWCEALTESQFDWGTEDLPAARAALARLAATRDQRLALAGSERERAFGAAVESFLADGTLTDRARGARRRDEPGSSRRRALPDSRDGLAAVRRAWAERREAV
jgi:hypothetical protein